MTRRRRPRTSRRATPGELQLLRQAFSRWRGLRLPNGLPARARVSPAQFEKNALAIGTAVEREHTSDPALAMEIAMAHLLEDPAYYSKLARLEQRPRSGARRLGASASTGAVAPVDRYTIAHGALGFVLGLWGAPWWVALGTTVTFELVEDKLKDLAPGLFPVGLHDTWANAIFDSVAWMTGWGLAQAVPPEPARIWQRSA